MLVRQRADGDDLMRQHPRNVIAAYSCDLFQLKNEQVWSLADIRAQTLTVPLLVLQSRQIVHDRDAGSQRRTPLEP